MKKYFWIVLLFIGNVVNGQVVFHSFQEVLDYAENKAVSIRSGLINEQMAQTERKEAKYNLFPTIQSSFGYNDNITLQPTLVPSSLFNPQAAEGEFQEMTFGTKYSYTRNFQVNWDVLNFQKIFQLQTANLKIEESRTNTDVHRFNTYNQLASTYYSVLLTQESISLEEKNLEVSRAIFKTAQSKFNSGLISEAELNRAEIKLIQNESKLKTSRNNLIQFTVQLQSQLNTKEEIKIMDSPSRYFLEDHAITSTHPEVLQQEIQLKKYEAQLKQQKAIRYPSLSLLYNNNQTWATNDFMDFSEVNELPQQSFGVQFKLPIISLGNKQKIDLSKQQIQHQELLLENTKIVKLKDDEMLQLQLEQANEQLAEHRKILHLQEKNDQHAINQYESGLLSLDQRLDLYDDLLIAQNNYLQSLAAQTLAQYKIYVRQIDF